MKTCFTCPTNFNPDCPTKEQDDQLRSYLGFGSSQAEPAQESFPARAKGGANASRLPCAILFSPRGTLRISACWVQFQAQAGTGGSWGAVGTVKLVGKCTHSLASTCARTSLKLTSLVLPSASTPGSLNTAFSCRRYWDTVFFVQWIQGHPAASM